MNSIKMNQLTKYFSLLIPGVLALGFTTEAQAVVDFNQYNDPSLFVDISATGTALGLSDDGTASINNTVGNPLIPAGTITVSNNGNIQSGSSDNEFDNTSLPYADFSTALMPFWDDIDSETGNVYWEETVVGGIDTLIVQWDNRPHFPNTGDATFQLQLFETGSTLARFAYTDVDFGSFGFDFGASATIGYQASSTVADQYSFNSPVLANGDVIDVTAVPFEFSPTLGLLFVGAGLGIKKGKDYLAKSKKVDLD